MLSKLKPSVIFLVLTIFLLQQKLSSQEIKQQAIDTLLTQYEQKSGESKILVLNRLIYEYSLFDSSLSFVYFKEQLKLTEKLKIRREQNWSYESLVSLLNEHRYFGSSVNRIKNGINYSDSIDCITCAAYGYSYLGHTDGKMRKFRKSVV
jgi:hypothetical protein